jgi:hypothetical protein
MDTMFLDCLPYFERYDASELEYKLRKILKKNTVDGEFIHDLGKSKMQCRTIGFSLIASHNYEKEAYYSICASEYNYDVDFHPYSSPNYSFKVFIDEKIKTYFNDFVNKEKSELLDIIFNYRYWEWEWKTNYGGYNTHPYPPSEFYNIYSCASAILHLVNSYGYNFQKFASEFDIPRFPDVSGEKVQLHSRERSCCERHTSLFLEKRNSEHNKHNVKSDVQTALRYH